jgi:hypothetical protein
MHVIGKGLIGILSLGGLSICNNTTICAFELYLLKSMGVAKNRNSLQSDENMCKNYV